VDVFFEGDSNVDRLSFDDTYIGDPISLKGDACDADLAIDISCSSTCDVIAGDEGAEYLDELDDKSDLEAVEEFISLIGSY